MTMNNSETFISRKELEELCELYFENRLAPEEELWLSELLSASGERGGVIDETIFLMGITRSTAVNSSHISLNSAPRIHDGSLDSDISKNPELSVDPDSSSNGLRENLLRWNESKKEMLKAGLRRIAISGIAAAVVIGAISAIWRISETPSKTTDQTVYSVFVEGREITDPLEAKRIVEKRYAEAMAQLNDIQKLEKEMLNNRDRLIEDSERIIKTASSISGSNSLL